MPAASAVLLLPSCTNSGGGSLAGHPSGTGPFDARGNYVEAWADNPAQWRRAPQAPVSEPTPDAPALVQNTPPPVVTPPSVPRPTTTTPVVHTRPQPRPAPTVAANTPKPKPVTSVAAPKPKPKPVAAKPAPKPSSSRYVVKKGDTLYAIAKRHGTSVGAIQKANRLSGTIIRPGQGLAIPR